MAKTVIELELRADGGQVTSTIKTIRGDLTGLEKTTDQATRGAAASFGRFQAAILSARSALTGLGAIIAVRSFTRLVTDAVDAGDAIQKASVRTGVAAETLSALKLQADLAGASFQGLETGIRTAQRNLNEFIAGRGEAKAAFDVLGIGSKEASEGLEDTAGFLELVAKRLFEIEEPGRRAALAQKLFQESGTQLLPLLDTLANRGIAGVTEEARRLGVVFDEDMANAMAEAKDNLTILGAVFEGFGVRATNAIVPVINRLGEMVGLFRLSETALQRREAERTIERLDPLIAKFERLLIQGKGGVPLEAEALEKTGAKLRELDDERQAAQQKLNELSTANVKVQVDIRREIEKQTKALKDQATEAEKDLQRRLQGLQKLEQEFMDQESVRIFEAQQQAVKATTGELQQQKTVMQQNADEAGRLILGVQGIVEAAISGTLSAADVGRRVLSELTGIAIQQLRQVFAAAQGQGAFVGATTAGIGGVGGTGGAVPGLSQGVGSIGRIPGLGGIGGVLGGAGIGIGLGGLIAGRAGQIGGGIGGALGGLANLVPLSALGVAGTAGAGSVGAAFGAAGTSIGASLGGALGGTIGGALASLAVPFVGALIGILIAFLVDQKPDPKVKIGAGSEVNVDPLTGQITIGEAKLTRFSFEEIDKSAALKVQRQVLQVLNENALRFSQILGVFPRFIVDRLIPEVEAANTALQNIFTKLSFSDRGPADIATELRRFAGRDAQIGFFLGTRGLLGSAVGESLSTAGIGGLGDLISEAFPSLPADFQGTRQTRFRRIQRELGGLQVPRKRKNVPAFIDALEQFAALSAGVAGGAPFLTGLDTSAIEDAFASVLSVRRGEDFPVAVERLGQTVSPAIQFIQEASDQARSIFSRGLTAAIEAANESQAKAAFLASFGQGIRETVFGGLQQAFLASAQFDTLLAPIQQTIRDFVQQSLVTGQPPDLAAFRTAILPTIETASERAVLLAPLAGSLNEFVRKLDAVLLAGGLGPQQASPPGPVTIHVNGARDPEAVAREIADLLGGRLQPSVG